MSEPPGGGRFAGWLFTAYLALVFWVPIPLGSNRYWSWALLELAVYMLAVAWLALFMRGRVRVNAVLRGARPMLLACALWLAYIWAQLMPLPIAWVGWLSPEAARWHVAAGWPAPPSFAPLTLDMAGTLDGALKSTAYIAFFALTLALLDRRARIAATAYTLVAAGLAQAVYGVITAAVEPGAFAQGTFPNRNHFAGYLELCLSAGLGLLAGKLTGGGADSWRSLLRDVLSWILSPRMQLRLALTIMVIALVMSRSRMGNTAFFSSMLATCAIAMAVDRRLTKSMGILLATLVVMDIYVVGAHFGLEKVVDRIARTELSDERREAVRAIDVWKEYPAFGSGLGSFELVFRKHKNSDMIQRYDYAHNDYIQFASETGALGLALAGTLVCMSFVAALWAYRIRRDPLLRGVAFGSMMGVLSFMIHSAVDFNLQIPSNALTFMLLLAFAWIALHHDRRDAPAPAAIG